MAGRWLDVNSMAEELGISTDAVRKRIARGRLESDRQDGHVLVWLDDGGTEAGREAEVDGGALLEAKDETIEVLREQLRAEREAHAEARRIIAALTQRIPAIEAAESPSEASPVPGRTPTEASDEPETGAQEPERRSWWRRWFGE